MALRVSALVSNASLGSFDIDDDQIISDFGQNLRSILYQEKAAHSAVRGSTLSNSMYYGQCANIGLISVSADICGSPTRENSPSGLQTLLVKLFAISRIANSLFLL